jgi:hypothetical protein
MSELIEQVPAEGILLHKSWGDMKMYTVACDCGCDDGRQMMSVEADDTGIAVYIYTTQKTNWWNMNRWQHIWTLLTKGYIATQSTTLLTQQQALNYAEVLKTAIKDVAEFRKTK